MEKKAILLIGYDSNLSLGVIYCLKHLNYTLYLLTSNRKNAARFSSHIKKTFYYNQFDEANQQIIELVKGKNIDLIMPIDELETRFVRQHSKALSTYATCTMATEIEMFDIGINKGLLGEFLNVHQVPCPLTLTAATVSELEIAAEKLGYPVLLKPNRSSFGRGILRFENWETLKEFYEKNNPKSGDFILQHFMVGSDITCNVICEQGEIICYTIQESPVKSGSDFSSNDILEFHNDDEVLATVGKMMSLLKWNGVACVDMRRDERDHKAYILEINGRFWASVVTSYVKAGINFPMIMAKLALGEAVSIPRQTPAEQISLKNYFDRKVAGKQVSLKDTKYGSYLADPRARLAQKLRL